MLFAHIGVVAGREAEFEAIARELATATLEREPGVRRYEYTRLSEPGSYHATLAFDDYDAFIAHQVSEHHVVIAGAMRDLIADIVLERVDPVPGCSALVNPAVPAVVRDLNDVDDVVLAERGSDHRERYPVPPSAWWSALGR
jgi:quinol monooxygenase YgiN